MRIVLLILLILSLNRSISQPYINLKDWNFRGRVKQITDTYYDSSFGSLENGTVIKNDKWSLREIWNYDSLGYCTSITTYVRGAWITNKSGDSVHRFFVKFSTSGNERTGARYDNEGILEYRFVIKDITDTSYRFIAFDTADVKCKDVTCFFDDDVPRVRVVDSVLIEGRVSHIAIREMLLIEHRTKRILKRSGYEDNRTQFYIYSDFDKRNNPRVCLRKYDENGLPVEVVYSLYEYH